MAKKIQDKHSAENLEPEIAVNIVTDGSDHIFTKYVGKLKVMPQAQPRISLGFFGDDNPLKGFSIELTPKPDPKNSIVTLLTSLGTVKRHELILHIANYGSRAVEAEIWQL